MKETFYISIDYYIYLKEIDFITDLLLKDLLIPSPGTLLSSLIIFVHC